MWTSQRTPPALEQRRRDDLLPSELRAVYHDETATLLWRAAYARSAPQLGSILAARRRATTWSTLLWERCPSSRAWRARVRTLARCAVLDGIACPEIRMLVRLARRDGERWPSAVEIAVSAMYHGRSVGDHRRFAWVCAVAGDRARALDVLGRALDLVESAGVDPEARADVLGDLARLHRDAGALRPALACTMVALDLAPARAPMCLDALALALALGDLERADDLVARLDELPARDVSRALPAATRRARGWVAPPVAVTFLHGLAHRRGPTARAAQALLAARTA